MKAKYILGGMILSWSDTRAGSPARPPRARTEPSSSRRLLILPVLQLKAMKCTMICFLLQRLVSTLFCLVRTVGLHLYHTYIKKKNKRENTIKIFLYVGNVDNCIHEGTRREGWNYWIFRIIQALTQTDRQTCRQADQPTQPGATKAS